MSMFETKKANAKKVAQENRDAKAAKVKEKEVVVEKPDAEKSVESLHADIGKDLKGLEALKIKYRAVDYHKADHGACKKVVSLLGAAIQHMGSIKHPKINS